MNRSLQNFAFYVSCRLTDVNIRKIVVHKETDGDYIIETQLKSNGLELLERKMSYISSGWLRVVYEKQYVKLCLTQLGCQVYCAYWNMKSL